jgi:hypothetical protein
VGDVSFSACRHAIAQTVRTPSFELGMPVLMDTRLLTVRWAQEDWEGHSKDVARLSAPGVPLRVAVLTTEARIPIALQTLQVMADRGIEGCAFTDYTTAVAWLGTGG